MKPQVNLHPEISQEETGITLNHILMMLIAGVVIAYLWSGVLGLAKETNLGPVANTIESG